MWKQLYGFENAYAINDVGQIKNIHTGTIRKPHLNKSNGYYQICLVKNHKIKTLYVHRLVLQSFTLPSTWLECVNHKDENKINNRLENLEWCTKDYNNKYNGKMERCEKAVIGTNILTGEEIKFRSARIASSKTDANYKNISACCRGLRHSAGGYHWRFA